MQKLNTLWSNITYYFNEYHYTGIYDFKCLALSEYIDYKRAGGKRTNEVLEEAYTFKGIAEDIRAYVKKEGIK